MRSVMHRIASHLPVPDVSPWRMWGMPTDQPAPWHHTTMMSPSQTLPSCKSVHCTMDSHLKARDVAGDVRLGLHSALHCPLSHLDLSCGHVVGGGVVPANGVDQARVVYIAVKLDLEWL